MPPKSESQKQLKELEDEQQAEQRAYAMPKVTDYGYEAGGDVQTKPSPSAKLAEMEARMSPAESTSYWAMKHKQRTGKK